MLSYTNAYTPIRVKYNFWSFFRYDALSRNVFECIQTMLSLLRTAVAALILKVLLVS